MKAPNIHTKGAALRLLAVEAINKEEDIEKGRSYLFDSEKFLKQSGDPIQIAKTWLEMARLELREKNEAKAKTLAHKAYKNLSFYNDSMFPDDLRFLLKKQNRAIRERDDYRDFFNRFIKIFESQSYSENVDQILSQILKYACRLFLAERGCIIVFDDISESSKPDLLAGYNITSFDINNSNFKPVMEIIKNAITGLKLEL